MTLIKIPQFNLVVQEGWQKWKLAHAFRLIGSGTTPLTSNTEYFQGEIPWINTGDLNDGYIYSVSKFISEKTINEFSALKVYPKGSLIIALYGATIGKLGILEIDACTNQACCVLAEPSHLDIKFVFYWLMSERPNIIELARGGGQPNISQEIVRQLRVLAPSIQLQKAIARYLDYKTAAIDTLIIKKQRLIQLLEEKRGVLINQAVTKGLNPNVPMKDSKIPWIGKIPKHWGVRRFKLMIDYLEQGWSPSCENRLAEEQEWGVLKVGCVNGGYFNELEHKALPSDLRPKLEYEIKTGDILVSRANTKELLGSAAIVHGVQRKLLLCDKLYRLKTVDDVDPAFFVILLKSKCSRHQFECDSSGASSSMQNISQESMRDFVLPLAPLQEQHLIVNILNKNFQTTDNLRVKLLNQIAKLQEYRQSLIAAAVTGKIDVGEEIA